MHQRPAFRRPTVSPWQHLPSATSTPAAHHTAAAPQPTTLTWDPHDPTPNHCSGGRGLRARYKWGFCKEFTIPYGLVHLKEKKQWHKGRTIISYYHSLAGNLLRITSRALDIILQHLYPQHPGQLSIPQLWQHFHTYLTQVPTDITLHATNDDLVGFFRSVPQHRLIDAVHSLVQHWQQQQSTHTITIDTHATGNPYHHSHIGRHHYRRPTQCTLHTAGHRNHCDLCAQHMYFPGMQHLRGAGIGSQLSPALCNAATTLIEHSWQQLHNNFLHNTNFHFNYYRYVDNRFITHNEHFLSHPASCSDPRSPRLLWRPRGTLRPLKITTSWGST